MVVKEINMIEKYIAALKEMENTNIDNGYDLVTWQANIINVIVRIYGRDSIQEQQVKQIKYKTYPSYSINGHTSGGGNNASFCKKQTSEIIQGLISDLTLFGLPEIKAQEKSGEINISVSQHQNQTINVNVIWESVKDELTGKQIKELEEILKVDDTVENKKIKTIDKLKSFGGDVVTNIIANILTNPSIFGI